MSNVTEKITIEEYKYERVKKSDVVVNIPAEPIFIQAYNHRVITGIFPQKASWDDGKVWEFQVVEICEDKTIMRTHLRISELSNIVSQFDIKNKTPEERLRDRVVEHLKDYYGRDEVPASVFVNKLNSFAERLARETGIKMTA